MATQSSAPTSAEEATTEMVQPIIVDLGRRRAARVKDLKAGEGELWDEVLDVVHEVKAMLGDEAQGQLLLPIIMIYEKRTARARIEQILFPLVEWDEGDDDDDDGEEDED
jgi:hypothetical protein